jgi:hypothetical protein
MPCFVSLGRCETNTCPSKPFEHRSLATAQTTRLRRCGRCFVVPSFRYQPAKGSALDIPSAGVCGEGGARSRALKGEPCLIDAFGRRAGELIARAAPNPQQPKSKLKDSYSHIKALAEQ